MFRSSAVLRLSKPSTCVYLAYCPRDRCFKVACIVEGMSRFELIFAEETFWDIVHVEAVTQTSSTTDVDNYNFRSLMYV